MKGQPSQAPAILKQIIKFTQQVHELTATLCSNPELVWDCQMNYWYHAVNLAQDQLSYWLEGKPMPMEDRRFSSEEWVNNPFLVF